MGAVATPGNGLLGSLVSFWQFDSLSGPNFPDSVGSNDFANNGMSLTGSGEINNCATGINNGFQYAINLTAPFNAGPGVSFSWSFWMKSTGGGYATGAGLLTKWSAGINDYAIWITGGNVLQFIANANDGSGNHTIDGPTTAGLGLGWHHVAFGYDASITKMWMQVDAGFRTQVIINDIKAQSVRVEINEFAFTGNTQNASYDEMGFWTRSLSTTDVSNIYAGGAALPFASFTT